MRSDEETIHDYFKHVCPTPECWPNSTLTGIRSHSDGSDGPTGERRKEDEGHHHCCRHRSKEDCGRVSKNDDGHLCPACFSRGWKSCYSLQIKCKFRFLQGIFWREFFSRGLGGYLLLTYVLSMESFLGNSFTSERKDCHDQSSIDFHTTSVA